MWQRNKKQKTERIKRELEQKKHKQCTFAPQIKRSHRSKSRPRKKDFNTSAFIKNGLHNYFERVDRARKMKTGARKATPPPLERKNGGRGGHLQNEKRRGKSKSRHDDSKYESRFRPMQMQKTEEDFFGSNPEQLFGSSRHKESEIVRQHESRAIGNSSMNDRVLNDLSRRNMNREGSPPSSSYSSPLNAPNMFAAQTKQLVQGLFSSNETGSLALLGSNFKHNHPKSNRHSDSEDPDPSPHSSIHSKDPRKISFRHMVRQSEAKASHSKKPCHSDLIEKGLIDRLRESKMQTIVSVKSRPDASGKRLMPDSKRLEDSQRSYSNLMENLKKINKFL